MLGLAPSAPTPAELNACSKFNSTWREAAGSQSKDKPQVCSVHANLLLSLCSSPTSSMSRNRQKVSTVLGSCQEQPCCTKPDKGLARSPALLASGTRPVELLQSFVSRPPAVGCATLTNTALQRHDFSLRTRTEGTRPILQIFQPISPLTSYPQVPWSRSSEAEWLEKFYEA